MKLVNSTVRFSLVPYVVVVVVILLSPVTSGGFLWSGRTHRRGRRWRLGRDGGHHLSAQYLQADCAHHSSDSHGYPYVICLWWASHRKSWLTLKCVCVYARFLFTFANRFITWGSHRTWSAHAGGAI